MTIELFDVRDGERISRALAIRVRVFVDEQHVPPQEEVDDHDRTDLETVHALATNEGIDFGAGRFYIADPQRGIVQIGRMAVDRDARGRGIGNAILTALVDEARRRGYRQAHLHAQTHAREFYAKAGFYDDGEQLLDAGILHQPMSLSLA